MALDGGGEAVGLCSGNALKFRWCRIWRDHKGAPPDGSPHQTKRLDARLWRCRARRPVPPLRHNPQSRPRGPCRAHVRLRAPGAGPCRRLQGHPAARWHHAVEFVARGLPPDKWAKIRQAVTKLAFDGLKAGACGDRRWSRFSFLLWSAWQLRLSARRQAAPRVWPGPHVQACAVI